MNLPVCNKHGRVMQCDKNEVLVLFKLDGADQEVRYGDRYKCPEGGELIIIGWADLPVASSWDKDFNRWKDYVNMEVNL